MQAKMERKREILRQKREEFGTSSSEDGDSSDEEIPSMVSSPSKQQSKSSTAGQGIPTDSSYVVLA